MIVVVIKANFAPGEEFRMLRQVGKLFIVRRSGQPGLVRVNTGSRIDPIVTLCKWQRRRQRVGASADGQNVPYACRLRSRQHLLSIGIEFRHVHVGMRIHQVELLGRRRAVFHGPGCRSLLQPGADRHILEKPGEHRIPFRARRGGYNHAV